MWRSVVIRASNNFNMNKSYHLYEQAIRRNKLLTPEQENMLEPKYAMLYATNVVGRKLHGPRVNQLMRNSIYAEKYSELPRPKILSFDAALAAETTPLNHNIKEPENDKEPSRCADAPKARELKKLITHLHDRFNCHPSMISSKEDWDKLKGNGLEMKRSALDFLENSGCCPHTISQIKNCIPGDDCGGNLMNILYTHAH